MTAASWGVFPNFGSLAEAETYSDRIGDAYFEICYHLEGDLNLSLKAMHDLYAKAPPNERPKMQKGIVREIICPEGWPEHPKTIVATLLSFSRYRHEDTCHAYTVNEAMTGFVLEKRHDGTMHDAAFDRRTLEPSTTADAEKIRRDLSRLCDWIESRFHWGVHAGWYRAPDCYCDDPDKEHLANIGVSQRHLAKFSERDRKRWEGIHARAADKHKDDLKMWGTVGKVQHNPEPRIWRHPDVDGRVIGLWPLVVRYNWTYADLLKVLDKLLPLPTANTERRYPLDSVESLQVHCRTICGLTKSTAGKTAVGMPAGWPIAGRLFVCGSGTTP
jgi:hypothetical protein